jgi:hypothetical protein
MAFALHGNESSHLNIFMQFWEKNIEGRNKNTS